MTLSPIPRNPARTDLAKRLASEFSPTIRDRGRSYFFDGRVKLVRGSDTDLETRVRGSQKYLVNLGWQRGELFATCACPYFEGGGACKHLWATILAADAWGYLSTPAVEPDLSLSFAFLGDDTDPDAEDDENLSLPSVPTPATQPARTKGTAEPQRPPWQAQIAGIAQLRTQTYTAPLTWPASRQILYAVNLIRSRQARCLVISPLARDAWADGKLKPPAAIPLKREQIAQVPSADDREILSVLAGILPYYEWGYTGMSDRIPEYLLVPHPLAEKVIALAARTGRFYRQANYRTDPLTPLTWDDGGPWHFAMELRRHPSEGWEAAGFLRRGEGRIELKDADLITPGGLVFTRDSVAPIAADTSFETLLHLRTAAPIHAPAKDLDELLGSLLRLPGLPNLKVPQDIQYADVTLRPRACLRIHAQRDYEAPTQKLLADLSFDYEGRQVGDHDQTRGFYLAEGRRFLRRDVEAELAAKRLLRELGVKRQTSSYWDAEPDWLIAPSKMPRVVRGLVEAGWHIEAEGKVFRRPGAFHIEVSSGVDWFELHGNVEYGETMAQMPELLEALRRGDSMVRLGDGTYGVLPEQWLRRIGLLAGLGTPEAGHIRFRSSQAGLLDALLASQPEACCDATFARVRDELGRFQGIEAAPQPDGFVGHLRDYQREGLGWMQFLRRFSFGGCLADDMGVGKTAQVLAMLETRREQRAAGHPTGPSLIVVPRSLVFNWKQEAARFTPQLRVLDYTGVSRDTSNLADYDVIVTTYGTLRRDVVRLKDVEFDYVVLDEAQAIKNAATEAAKAVRLLRGGQRLALSGTPVENHLGELWSLFEFLNPGMLGRASVLPIDRWSRPQSR